MVDIRKNINTQKNIHRIMKRNQYSAIFIVILLMFFTLNTSDNYLDVINNFIPEIIGMIITYQIIDYIIEQNEERRIKPLKSLVYRKISYILYDLLNLFDDFPVPEHYEKTKIEILKETNRNLIELMDYGSSVLSEMELNHLTNIEEKIGMMIEQEEHFGDFESYYSDWLDVLTNCEPLISLTGREDYPPLLAKSREKTEAILRDMGVD